MSKYLHFIIKIVVILVLITISIELFSIAPNFIPKEEFNKADLRVVVDDKDITNELFDRIYVQDGVIMMSTDTIKKYFDVFVYHDEKYDTAIITTNDMIGKIKLGENVINVNGENKEITGTAKFLQDDISESGELESKLYIPMNLIEEVTKVNVYFNNKVVCTTPKGVSRATIIVNAKRKDLKMYKKDICARTGVAREDEKLFVFETKGKELTDYVTVRNERGDIGFIEFGKIEAKQILSIQGDVETELSEMINDIKQCLTWEFAQNSTPDRTGQTKIKALDIISPTWIEVKNTNGDLSNTIDKNYINWARSQGYKLWPAVKNDRLNIKDLSTIMNDMQLREKLINNIVKYVIDYEFDGINIDFENMYKEDKNLFSQFIRELAASLRYAGNQRQKDLKISVDVTIPGGSDTYSLCYDRRALANAVDYVMLMAYDQNGIWSKKAGPTASLSWVESNIQTMLGYEGVDKDKLFLCVPFYSPYWVVDSETNLKKDYFAITMVDAKKILEDNKSKASWSEEDGQYYVEYTKDGDIIKLWVEDEKALEKKIELVNKYDLAGIATWRFGLEARKITWDTIDKNMNFR